MSRKVAAPDPSRDAGSDLEPDCAGALYDATAASAITEATPRLMNVSARAWVETAGDGLIAGFVIGGSTAQTVLIRGGLKSACQGGYRRTGS